MAKKKGNPSWYKGMPSANPEGRPRGKTSLYAFLQNPSYFTIRHLRWENFCCALIQPPYTGAAAARKAGYSSKSARFIASRLRRNPVGQEMLRRIQKRIDGTKNIGNGVYLIPDDEGDYHVYRDKTAEKEATAFMKRFLRKH